MDSQEVVDPLRPRNLWQHQLGQERQAELVLSSPPSRMLPLRLVGVSDRNQKVSGQTKRVVRGVF